jgi:hypothetical protein
MESIVTTIFGTLGIELQLHCPSFSWYHGFNCPCNIPDIGESNCSSIIPAVADTIVLIVLVVFGILGIELSSVVLAIAHTMISIVPIIFGRLGIKLYTTLFQL